VEWWKLRNVTYYDALLESNIMRIKARILRWSGNVACIRQTSWKDLCIHYRTNLKWNQGMVHW